MEDFPWGVFILIAGGAFILRGEAENDRTSLWLGWSGLIVGALILVFQVAKL